MAVQVLRRVFTVDEYHRMAAAHIFGEDDRVELIEGEVVQMTPVGSRHAACVKRLIRLLDRGAGERAIVGAQDPIRLGTRSEPQPDVVLLRPRPDFYAAAHPGPDDVILVIEVAETSAEYDRSIKVPLYGQAGIPEAWLVDLAGDCVEVFRTPAPQGYREVQRVQRGQSLSPQVFPDVEFTVDEVIG